MVVCVFELAMLLSPCLSFAGPLTGSRVHVFSPALPRPPVLVEISRGRTIVAHLQLSVGQVQSAPCSRWVGAGGRCENDKVVKQ